MMVVGQRTARACRVVSSTSWICGAIALLGVCVSCERGQKSTSPAVEGSASSTGLAPELASRVLAKVGERTITLGDFAQALERMDRFERLRYQTPERRKLLLDEMIDAELLAREAERRGIDKEPETQAALDQLYTDALLRELRDKQPALEELPISDVQAYYTAHPDEFTDPERRRVAVISVPTRALAERLIKELSGADAKQSADTTPGGKWGEAVRRYSKQPESALPAGAPRALELAGDLGLVSAPGDARGANPKIPEPVRAAAFRIPAAGQLAPEPVASDGSFYVVRLVAINGARTRTLAEADTMIRARLIADRVAAAERELQDRVRAETPVTINEAALEVLRARLANPAASAAPPSPAASTQTPGAGQ